jgi:hypothetical protein
MSESDATIRPISPEAARRAEGIVSEIRSALATPDHKSDTPQQFQRCFWPPADAPARDELISLLESDLRAVSTHADIADAIIEAGWVNLQRFRHDTTNTLGMFMVHEDGDPDLGYDRGIVDAMDVVNGTLWTGPGALDCRAAHRGDPEAHIQHGGAL